MKILFCSGEVYPFSKSGGLADVSSSLPKSIKKRGHDIIVITPLYQRIDKDLYNLKLLGVQTVTMGNIKTDAIYYETIYDGIRYVFIDNKHYFDRYYFYNEPDDAERFTFFNFAILESLPLINFYPDIIHVNDWQTALVPYLLDQYRKNEGYEKIETLLSIHNLEKQGAYSLENEHLFNLKNFTYIHLNQINFLKCGIMRASKINTVSKSYKDEALTKFYGFTLDGPLKSRIYDLHGILNGLDVDTYDPSFDKNIINFDDKNFDHGKKENKNELLNNLKLNDLPLFSFIGRLGRQKGIDLMIQSLSHYLDKNLISLVVVGSGDVVYESYFKELMEKYPKNVYFHQGFDHKLQQKTYAASDFFLMPSLFEPCGLNQMIAMSYGAIPVVRHTGGLIDTVTSYQLNPENGYGITFKNYDFKELNKAIDLSLDIYKNKNLKNSLIEKAMKIKFNMDEMTDEYLELYEEILDDAI